MQRSCISPTHVSHAFKNLVSALSLNTSSASCAAIRTPRAHHRHAKNSQLPSSALTLATRTVKRPSLSTTFHMLANQSPSKRRSSPTCLRHARAHSLTCIVYADSLPHPNRAPRLCEDSLRRLPRKHQHTPPHLPTLHQRGIKPPRTPSKPDRYLAHLIRNTGNMARLLLAPTIAFTCPRAQTPPERRQPLATQRQRPIHALCRGHAISVCFPPAFCAVSVRPGRA